MTYEVKYKPPVMKSKIVQTHIEKDLVNDAPTLVFTDEGGQEWVFEEQTSQYGGYITKLVLKKDSWFFNPDNKK